MMGLECQECHDLKLSNRPVRTRMPGGVAGVLLLREPPMPMLPRGINPATNLSLVYPEGAWITLGCGLHMYGLYRLSCNGLYK